MIRTLLSLLPASHRGRVTGYAVLTVGSVLLRAVGVVLLVPLVEALFSTTPRDALPWVAALTAATAAGWFVDSRAARVGYDLGFATLDGAQHDIADRLTRVPLGWFTSRNTATARQAIASTGPDLVGLFAYQISPLAQAVLLPVTIGLALLPIAWPLGLAALAGVPVLLGALWASGRITRRADRVAADANSALTERIVEFARTQQALRAARRVEPARGQTGAALAAQHGATVRLLLLQIPGQLLFGVASQAALLLMAGTTTLLATRGVLDVPEAVALIVVIARYLEPFAVLGDLAPGVETTRTTLGRIRTVLDAPAAAAKGAAAPPTGDSVDVDLRDVVFRYDRSDAPVLDGLRVTFEAGRTTAIVGPSGSGKSTLLALVAGLLDPTEGTVTVGGHDLASLDAESRRGLASVVFQDPYLFEGTIRQNVLAGRPGADDDQLARAMTLARVDELVARLPDGLDTRVGEAGVALSGGERQRVSIARALLKPAPVLLLDEATSALDTENEAAVAAAITHTRQRTRIVVAHRLATIRGADRVLFLEHGRIVEDGPVEALLDSGGRFAEFWRQQHDAAGWRIAEVPAVG
ncbi:ABC transporter ATP-binding protein [Frankia sp. CNm7]|uniref:ABC transporter ATP-binding protein n=1 Tax=Frankia nepalensis TaxID=1836974 RepID=A0A937RCX9_9ACTN|nr:ABC transporter ATP-binding protein [Frankia nepalensis]MBL7495738.1 ABC transporter ATP-binding protein [Frankia nepalensis]MBL7509012.1 ABC transporter ATP-binding protein [Frankia nepalensis]MBL7523691.1 ABC transporter ATP-binding protein [Frankia nepalensis]MBL7629811.1 ABC transporter ATP-binding protein [Frankia nepalensis]